MYLISSTNVYKTPNRIRYYIMAYILNKGDIATKGTKIISSGDEKILFFNVKKQICVQCTNRYRVYWWYYNFIGGWG